MKHDWEFEKKTQANFLNDPKRVCKNCGAIQSKSSNQSWGKVTEYQWWPLVGRCKTK